MKGWNILVGLLFLVGLAVTTIKPQTIGLPSLSQIESLELSSLNQKTHLISKDEISKFIHTISKETKSTKLKSNSKNPSVEKYVTVRICHKNGKVTIAYIYEKNKRKYIEKPYSGIWEISGNFYKK